MWPSHHHRIEGAGSQLGSSRRRSRGRTMRSKRLSSWKVLLHPCWEHYQLPNNECGGHLHVALDDGNLDSHFILDDLKQAEERGDTQVANLCELLLRASMSQREKLYRNYGMYCWGAEEPENVPE
jgi:hypothetical protein